MTSILVSPPVSRSWNEAGAFRQNAIGRAVHATRDAALKLAGVCAALLVAAGFLAPPPQAVPESTAPASVASPVAWFEITGPAPVYALAAPQLLHEKFTYQARRHASGGGREDSLTFGDFAGGRIFLRLAVYRHGAEKTAEDAPLFVEMARRAAPLGLSVVHASFEPDQPTRFGALEMATLTLSAGESKRENCRGFRLVQRTQGVTIAGLACAAAAETLTAADLACLVNRLDLSSPGDDRALRAFFAGRSPNPSACGADPASQPAPRNNGQDNQTGASRLIFGEKPIARPRKAINSV
jgi:hypothetical protein